MEAVKRYAAMKDSGVEWIGEIPRHWDCRKISHCFCLIGSGTTPKSNVEEYYDGNIPWIQSGDINGGDLSSTAKLITESAVSDNSALSIYRSPFIVIAMYGASIANICKVYIDACTNQACCVLSNPENWISFDFAFYILRSAKIELLNMARGGTQPNISQDIIKHLKITSPPLVEQQAIASYLDAKCSAIDDIIASARVSIDDYKKLKASTIYEAVTKGLNPDVEMKDSGVEWIGKMPSHWNIDKLKRIVSTPLQYGANESGIPYEPTLPRYIRITDISNDGTLKKENALSLPQDIATPYMLHKNDILLARSGATVGKAFFFDYDIPAVYAGYLIRAVIDEDKALPKFIFFNTLGSGYQNWKDSILIQSTIQNISANRYNEFVIALPPLSEQQAIADYLNTRCAEIDSLIAEKEALIADLEAYKKSLMYECVTGKRRVTEDSHAP